LELLAASIRNGEFEGKQRRGDDGSKILYLPLTFRAMTRPRDAG
jgi:hypothetical protein